MDKASDKNIPEIDVDNSEFLKARDLINHSSRSVFLTGKAGTGKSTFLRYITAHTRKKFVVLAPTGIAAVNVGGQTLHSFFRLPFHPVMPDDPDFARDRLSKRMKYPGWLIKTLREVELIIIDEVSMVRADTIDFIDKLLRHYGGNRHLPFAGKQLLLVGDLFQLEPVISGDVRDIIRTYYRHPFFFCARAFEDLQPVSIELRKVYRQTDTAFISLLDRVREGQATSADFALINSKVLPPDTPVTNSEGEFVMTLASRRDTVDYINDAHLKAIDRPEFTFEGSIEGDFPENSLPTDKILRLKEGAQVVFIKNDPEKRWVNGTLGRITFIGGDSLQVTLENGDEHFVEREMWGNVRYKYNDEKKTIDEEVLGTFTQYPVKLAWALTIHKSQGLTFSKVCIDIGQGAFAGGQTYVALSRCRSLEGLSLRATVAPRDVFVNPAITAFARSFNDPVLYETAMRQATAAGEYEAALAAVRGGRLPEAFDHFIEGLRNNSILDNEKLLRFARAQLGVLDRYKREIESLKSVIEKDRERFVDMAAEYFSMGLDCLQDDMPGAAIANFDKTLTLAPDHIEALRSRAEARRMMDDFSGALDDLNRLLSLRPDDFKALLAAGALYLESFSDPHNALNTFLKATDILEVEADQLPKSLVIEYHDLGADIFDAVDAPDEATIHRRAASRLRRSPRKK
ncbi:MAG: AAA family ATPase [Duncaniella sp.]|nr:AAA family ATPase [Duncaniella sp.]